MLCGMENTKSLKIAEKLRFNEEGTIKQETWIYDRFVDFVCYGLFMSERQFNVKAEVENFNFRFSFPLKQV